MNKILILLPATSKQKERLNSIFNTWYRDIQYPHKIKILGDLPLFNEFGYEKIWLCANGENDTWGKLPLKMLNGFRMALLDQDWDFLYKCDDDTFLDFNRLKDLISTKDKFSYLYMGKMFTHQYSFIAGGGGYIITRQTLLKAWEKLEENLITEGSEDQIIAKSMRESSIEILDCPLFGSEQKGFETINKIKNHGYISGHRVYPKHMKITYEANKVILENRFFEIIDAKTGHGELGLNGFLGYENRRILLNDVCINNSISAHAPSQIILKFKNTKEISIYGAINDSGKTSALFSISSLDKSYNINIGIANKLNPTKKYRIKIPQDNFLVLSISSESFSFCHSLWVVDQ